MRCKMSNLKKHKFWVLLAANIVPGILWRWGMWDILLALFLIWLNYIVTHDLKKMLMLDVMQLIFTQAGVWRAYYIWLGEQVTVDVGATLMQLFIIFHFIICSFMVMVMMTWYFIMHKREKEAWTVGIILAIGLGLLGFIGITIS